MLSPSSAAEGGEGRKYGGIVLPAAPEGRQAFAVVGGAGGSGGCVWSAGVRGWEWVSVAGERGVTRKVPT